MDICLWEVYQKMLSDTIHIKEKGKAELDEERLEL